jgi:hypothetical protein
VLRKWHPLARELLSGNAHLLLWGRCELRIEECELEQTEPIERAVDDHPED